MTHRPLAAALFVAALVSCASARPSSASRADQSITNNQEAGVDEGDIVKAAGEYFVILRRGRLFTVKVAGSEPLSRVDQIDARAPGQTEQAWYDEMLVHGSRVIVIGFSYATSSTELGLFRLDANGRLSHEATYYLRSNDYYSARNYASRLVEGTLVFYMPYWGAQGPALARAGRGGGVGEWSDLLDGVEVHHADLKGSDALHAVVRCPLDQPGLRCTASAFAAPYARTFYVSPTAVYIWVAAHDTGRNGSAAVVYRMPLDGSAVTSLRVRGVPIDQFSFQELDGRLYVLVQGNGPGDAMWGSERDSEAPLALVRAPLGFFSAAGQELGPQGYQPLPRPAQSWALQNRFVGHHLLWGAGSGWRRESVDRHLFIADVRDPAAATALVLSHQVERIEPLGNNALVVGQTGDDLAMSTVALSESPAVAQTHVARDFAQGETRSHGFFFHPDDEGGGGVLGLPVRKEGGPWWHLFESSAEVSFVRVSGALELEPLGALASRATNEDDHCEVSCVDWYGNARPIFYRQRVFALMGYELVEGRLSDHAISEVSRLEYLSRSRLHMAKR